MAHPVLTKAFPKPTPYMTMLFHPLGESTHLPLSLTLQNPRILSEVTSEAEKLMAAKS